ncbi:MULTISPECIES: hypothetical protein [unclassified Proteiniphilum]|jgi:predicted aspartyl protease|uniref:hypothetical protein n=3 Tax=Proteiniphilum TaxID=294702 RepID=UPI00257ED101|nr:MULTISPECIES: hypothetical protein [unclassified Proteiniphilum]
MTLKEKIAGRKRRTAKIILLLFISLSFSHYEVMAQIKAGTGKSNITADSGNINDSLYVKTLVLENGELKMAIITMDVVAIGTIGNILDNFLDDVRNEIESKFGIKREHILVSASHNHHDGFLIGENWLCNDIQNRTISAVEKAILNLEPVKIGTGTGSEDRFAMNRRINLKNGKVFTIRHANPNMQDEEIADLGEIDPEIGILKIDRLNGTPKAILYNYACHPYTGVPNKRVTAEYPGFASQLIEEQLGQGAMAFFLQGAAGDITEIMYKDVNHPRDSEPFGQMLGLNVLNRTREIATCETKRLSVVNKVIYLPLRSDFASNLNALEMETQILLDSLRSTSLNLKTFLPLYLKYKISESYPSYYKYLYLDEEKKGTEDFKKLDESNRRDIDKYIRNIHIMERLSHIREDIYWLKLRKELANKTGGTSIPVEILGIRIGDFILVSFPGEAFAAVGLSIKKMSPYPFTFLSAYSNGYIHYAPDKEAFQKGGYEVTNCILAPEWQETYEKEILRMIKQL